MPDLDEPRAVVVDELSEEHLGLPIVVEARAAIIGVMCSSCVSPVGNVLTSRQPTISANHR